jgi:hypothetical protein
MRKLARPDSILDLVKKKTYCRNEGVVVPVPPHSSFRCSHWAFCDRVFWLEVLPRTASLRPSLLFTYHANHGRHHAPTQQECSSPKVFSCGPLRMILRDFLPSTPRQTPWLSLVWPAPRPPSRRRLRTLRQSSRLFFSKWLSPLRASSTCFPPLSYLLHSRGESSPSAELNFADRRTNKTREWNRGLLLLVSGRVWGAILETGSDLGYTWTQKDHPHSI